MTMITPGVARVRETLRFASKLASPVSEKHEVAPDTDRRGPPDQDYYERTLALDMQANWLDVFEALRTIVRPSDVATITQEELGKHIDYFAHDLARNYFEGKVFVGQDGDRLTNSPDEYMQWLKAKVTPETGPGVAMPIDQMSEAFQQLKTDEEREEFIKRNGIRLPDPVVLFPALEQDGPRTAPDLHLAETELVAKHAPDLSGYVDLVSRSEAQARTVRELIESLDHPFSKDAGSSRSYVA